MATAITKLGGTASGVTVAKVAVGSPHERWVEHGELISDGVRIAWAYEHDVRLLLDTIEEGSLSEIPVHTTALRLPSRTNRPSHLSRAASMRSRRG